MPPSENPLKASTYRRLMRVGRWVHRRGLVAGPAGNISLRLSDEWVLMNRSGARLGRLLPGDLVVVGLDGERRDAAGPAPSIELPLHLAVYRARPDVGGIIHSHSPGASLYARGNRKLDLLSPEARAWLGEVGLATGAAGTEKLALSAVAALGERRAVLLEEHGAVAVGPDIEEAYDAAEVLEDLALLNYRHATLGPGAS